MAFGLPSGPLPRWVRRVGLVLVGLALLAILVWAFVPRPVDVDVARVVVGPMQVTVDDDGQTRVAERYVVMAPVSGMMRRIPYDVGDRVSAGQVIARIADPPAPLLDARARAEAAARLGSARARLVEARERIPAAQATVSLRRRELGRLQQAAAIGAATCEQVEQAADQATQAAAELAALRAAAEQARYGVREAEVALSQPGEGGDQVVEVRSPVRGRIFELRRESGGPVTAGEELVTMGDLDQLEAVIDVLTTQAVEIEVGAPATLTGWGGGVGIPAYVERIEPSAFTELSALGVEEQRVNVVLQLARPEERLGDGWRVQASIVVWAAPRVVQVPESAVFREGQGWAVFAVQGGRARLRPIVTGRRNGDAVQVLDGLRPGEPVVIYPGEQIDEGVRVSPRSLPPVAIVPEAQAR